VCVRVLSHGWVHACESIGVRGSAKFVSVRGFMSASVSVSVWFTSDAGRTQVAAGAATVTAIGPAAKSRVDAVTGKLRLF
jgi:peptidyl-tRNA hydrolase